MRYNIHLITLAVLVALALAAVSGALLPADNVVHAEPPEFVDGAGTRSVPENTPPGVNIGAPISATDDNEAKEEFGDTLTYSLGGTDAASFDIDASTGQLITKAALDEEKKDEYSVTVKVEDSESPASSDTQVVTISVTEVVEPPAAPAAPTVVSYDDTATTDADESSTSLKVVWHAPENTGSVITGYAVQYKKSSVATTFDTVESDDVTIATKTATITDLEVGTSYLVRVNAKNDEGTGPGPWSLVGIGSTNREENKPPTFNETSNAEGVVTRAVSENTGAGQNVGVAVGAVDTEALRPLTYRLGGPDADSFDFSTSSGQIGTKRGVTYDRESKSMYYVTVTAFDGAGGSNALGVAISVTNKLEAPSAPARPTVKGTVRGTEKDSRSLDVSWKEPENTGPPITSYSVQYRKAGSSNYLTRGATVIGATATIAPTDDTDTDDDERLESGVPYEVRVRALNGELNTHGNWSPPATGRTSAGNQEAKFIVRSDTEARKADRATPEPRTVDENTPPERPVGRVVAARDTDQRTYKLVAAPDPDEEDVGKFDINESTGQILTKAPLNYEDAACGYDVAADAGECTYTVIVEVWDGLDEHGNKEEGNPVDVDAAERRIDDRITVEITVDDRPEPPSKPVITVTSPMDGRSLSVVWDAPDNTGPAIASYEVECTGDGVPTGTCPASTPAVADDPVTSTITELSVGKSYRVRVRALNGELNTHVNWSNWVSQSTNRMDNVVPVFSTPLPTELAVNENDPARTVLPTPVAAESDGSSGSIRYTVEGPHTSLFDIDTNGQILTRRLLNHEDAACYDTTDSEETKCEYTVRVKAADSDFGSHYHDVTISVVDLAEPPDQPSAPGVTATKDSGLSLEVTWNKPDNKGPAITSYAIRYRTVPRQDETVNFTKCVGTACSITITERKATIRGLEPRTQYEVHVRAMNDEGDSEWSPLGRGRGTTGASNNRPIFEDTSSLVTLKVDENTRAGQNVGSAVSARDAADRNRLTYSLEGPGASAFAINSSTGQIRTRSPLDYESRQSYSVTVKVNDGQRKGNSVAAKSVTIEIGDAEEFPSAPPPPKVSGVRGSTDSVRVTWDEPKNTGTRISDYDLQYRASGSPGWSDQNAIHEGVDRSAIITGLTPGTRYEVQVRATNGDGPGDYSRSGTGSPNPDVANQRPVFSPSGARTFAVGENTVAAGDPIGTAVMAVDPDFDPVTHTLEGTDAASFTIDPGSGQIRASTALNYEEKSRYSVTVKATDTRGGSATVRVTIAVTDVDESPSTPLAPTVTTASSTSLSVGWEAPENTGPPITDYDYRYREASVQAWTEVTNTPITGTSVTVSALDAGASYDVQVRAKNAEGVSDWSNSGIGATAAAGANSPPVFVEGTSATRSVSVTAAAGANIGEPVAAMDDDEGDSLTYSLGGTDVSLFAIQPTTGQIVTTSGIALTVGTTYEVTVAATDGKETARITVTIEVTAAPPNNPPVFIDGASTTRSVREDTPAGTSIGAPVRATDADQGDTVAYSLEGADSSSFDIVASSGQIRSLAALDASTKSTYTVTVVASDGKDSDRIAVTITVTPRPTTFGCATRGAVSDASNTGLVADCEALMASRNALEGRATRLDWSESTPIEQWEGVSISGTPRRVTRLNLMDRGLSGTIPDALGGLSMLTHLNLRSNLGLSGEIPDALGNLRNLRLLNLHSNSHTGAVPDLSRIRGLEELYLPNNADYVTNDDGKKVKIEGTGLTGEIPTWLNGMTNMEELWLWGNSLTGTVPNLSGMTGLEKLKLANNDLDGGIGGGVPQASRLPPNMTWLIIDRNPFGGTIPDLSSLSRLRLLWLHSNQLTGSIPDGDNYPASLDDLNLRDNRLTGTIPDLSALDNLTRLRLHNNSLSGEVPATLGDLDSLKQLWLHNEDATKTVNGNNSFTSIAAGVGDLADTLIEIALNGNPWNANACVPVALANVTTNDYTAAGIDVCDGS